ncbi:hypothetical protein ACFY0R_37690 [Streptomyces sp. NPDC001633]|uniref:hypothetical protein n=1 Tax=Streptomyces sp. NPDC001633 TaxID=3364595 RepID=UPI0036843FD2
MSDWRITLPDRLGDEIAHLTPSGRRAVHDALAALARDPRSGTPEPITAAEIRRVTTSPDDAGDRITLLYRVHATDRAVEIIWIISGP